MVIIKLNYINDLNHNLYIIKIFFKRLMFINIMLKYWEIFKKIFLQMLSFTKLFSLFKFVIILIKRKYNNLNTNKDHHHIIIDE